MVDVLELAQQRRAVLLKEVETLDWFIEVARQLTEASATPDLLVNEVALDTEVPGVPEADKPTEVTITATPSTVQATHTVPAEPAPQQPDPVETKPATASAQSPINSLNFKRMLNEMRRKHQDRTHAEREMVAASV